jgi:hypothetical protein
MGVKGNRKKENSKILSWSDTKISDKLKNYGWSQDASNAENDTLYRLYYDNDKEGVYLLDINNDVTYQVPYGAKAKGYMLAFKLFDKD